MLGIQQNMFLLRQHAISINVIIELNVAERQCRVIFSYQYFHELCYLWQCVRCYSYLSVRLLKLQTNKKNSFEHTVEQTLVYGLCKQEGRETESRYLKQMNQGSKTCADMDTEYCSIASTTEYLIFVVVFTQFLCDLRNTIRSFIIMKLFSVSLPLPPHFLTSYQSTDWLHLTLLILATVCRKPAQFGIGIGLTNPVGSNRSAQRLLVHLRSTILSSKMVSKESFVAKNE